jgi:CTP synthase
MQLAAVEYALMFLKWKNANTEEVDCNCSRKIIHSIPFNEKYQRIKGNGVSMRLGAYDCVIKPGTLIWQIYNKHKQWKKGKKGLVSERHRHRFEFNNKFRNSLSKAGMVISGTSPDDFFVETIELPKEIHPFFIATQAHPEYKSTPWKPHAMFLELGPMH